ncbi:helix-turn-helix transcriptional regulator [Candidatus Leptofilum sp.]|uniref:helix-turn-helix transcriptional regulator n=1 Tax=Candidatus Leptofilum sp. TaxID=3241576 RepID=UPI003B5BE419
MRADRLLSLMMLLQTRGQMTAVALAKELEVTPRTIYRDVEALSSTGVPIYATGGPGGGYGLLDSYRTTLTELHEDEVKALFMMAISGPLSDLGMNQSLQTAVLKLTSALPSQQQAQATFFRQRLHLDAAAWFQESESAPLLSVVQTAVWQDRQLQITYRRPSGSVSERLVRPYGLVAKAAVWYLVADTPDGMRVYRVARLETAELTDNAFTRSPAFDLVAYWQEWMTNYVSSLPQIDAILNIESSLLSMLPSIWNIPVTEQSEQDSTGWQTVKVVFERKEQAVAIVLGLGTSTTVVSPEWLREQVLSAARGIVAKYEG